ncbi:MAG: hypothetical protein LBP62_07990 [Clostridiales bacterium]|jgi:3-dehydroquinate dehydratase|nr:hypothetical protein [Clostridiales bacterium]
MRIAEEINVDELTEISDDKIKKLVIETNEDNPKVVAVIFVDDGGNFKLAKGYRLAVSYNLAVTYDVKKPE